MKLLAVALTLLCFVGGATAQDPPPTLARDHLLGAVKSVETGRVGYVRDQGKYVEGKAQIFQRLSFDERGDRIKATTYQDGTIAERLVYTYDPLGRNTGYDEYFSLSKETLQGPRKHIYTLDTNGKIVEYMVYDTGGTVASRFTYQYDPKGNKIEEDFYSWTGKQTGRLVYTYDGAGHNLTQTSYNADDVINWKTVNTYDAEGRMIEWAEYQKEVLRYKKFFRYDKTGRLSEEETLEFNKPPNVFSDHAPVPGKIVHKYNDSERSQEIATYDPGGTLKKREVHLLDDNGNEIGWIFFNQDGSETRTKTEFDSHGNWIRRLRQFVRAGAQEAQPSGGEYRNIVYYK